MAKEVLLKTVKDEVGAIVDDAYDNFNSPVRFSNWERVIVEYNDIISRLEAVGKTAVKIGTFIGRSFSIEVADGFAIYVVADATPQKFVISLVPLGDGYSVKRYGNRAVVGVASIKKRILADFRMKKFFDATAISEVFRGRK